MFDISSYWLATIGEGQYRSTCSSLMIDDLIDFWKLPWSKIGLMLSILVTIWIVGSASVSSRLRLLFSKLCACDDIFDEEVFD